MQKKKKKPVCLLNINKPTRAIKQSMINFLHSFTQQKQNFLHLLAHISTYQNLTCSAFGRQLGWPLKQVYLIWKFGCEIWINFTNKMIASVSFFSISFRNKCYQSFLFFFFNHDLWEALKSYQPNWEMMPKRSDILSFGKIWRNRRDLFSNPSYQLATPCFDWFVF